MPLPSNTLKFLLGPTPVELDLSHHPTLNPSTTVLNYLRSLNGFKGVKEGCAEGDCGACTVVVAFPNSRQELTYMAVNSCLVFLPWLQGKQLITVEHLSEASGLHPVQQLMVDLYGSQCGFCTPGIVMSLFGLFKSHIEPTRENAVQMLSGNLCRCTGYQPILEAAIKALGADGKDHFSTSEPDVLQALISMGGGTRFNNGKQQYARPSTLKDALALRKEWPDAVIVSGATDIALRQSKKFEFLPKILDISAVSELQFFKEEQEHWTVGSGMNIEELWYLASHKVPLFDEVFRVFASHQIRNLATVGGNIGSASPIGDTLPVMLALDASVVLISERGSRTVPLDQYITGYRKTVLAEDELIHSVIIPKPSPRALFRFFKVSKRKELDISTVSLAASLELNPDQTIGNLKLAFGGIAEKPVRARSTEDSLLGRAWNRETVEGALPVLLSEFSPISDARSGKEGRQLMARNLLLKFFAESHEPVNHE